MIVQNVSARRQHADMTFTVGQADLAARAGGARTSARRRSASSASWPTPNVAKVSVIGVGMRSHAGIANTMFQTLADKGINIQVISTSEIKVSVLIDEEYTELAVRALHTAYGLDGGRLSAMPRFAAGAIRALDRLVAIAAAASSAASWPSWAAP